MSLFSQHIIIFLLLAISILRSHNYAPITSTIKSVMKADTETRKATPKLQPVHPNHTIKRSSLIPSINILPFTATK